MERLLDDLLWFVLGLRIQDGQVASAMMRRAEGKQKLLNLYKDLVGISAQKCIEEAGHGSWFKDWRSVAEARNKVAHGKWWGVAAHEIDFALLDRVRDGAFEAISVLHNAAVDAQQS